MKKLPTKRNGLNLRGGYKLIEKRNRGYIIDSDTIR